MVNIPAFDVSLAHEISFQFGDHDADDPDEDKKVDLQNTRGGGGVGSSHLSPSHQPGHSPGAPASAPTPNSATYADSKENGQADYEPVVHVGVPGPAAGEEETGT